jgi:hypothetical protein
LLASNENEGITTDLTEVKSITEEYCEYGATDNLDGMGEYRRMLHTLTLDVEHLNRPNKLRPI